MLAGCLSSQENISDKAASLDIERSRERPDPAAALGGAAWASEVQARLRDASHAFEPDGGRFRVAAPEVGLDAWFDAEGADIVSGADRVYVRPAWVGRGEGVVAPSGLAPILGACAPEMFDPSGECIRRLELEGDGFTEWWVAGADGLEQGWTVDASFGGEGPLIVEVVVDGGRVVVSDGDLWVEGDGGALLRVTGLRAEDVTGAPLDARFVATAEGYRIEVDDTDARYPVEIDPTYSSASWSITGLPSNSTIAATVGGAGDVDGDGYDDVVVSADDDSYVYHGSSSGVSSTATSTLTGDVVAGAGDVNGDGYGDVIVGESCYSSCTGRAYVHHGSSSGVSETATSTLDGQTSYDYFGSAVAGAGDVNRDGYDDVVVGAYSYGSTGRAYVYHGSATGVSTSAAKTLTGGGNYQFGDAVSAAGDVNGDGYDDIIVGAYYYTSSTGAAYVYLGSATGVTTSGATTLVGQVSGDKFGESIAAAGDVDGDGFDDILVGATGYGSDNGRAYLYAGDYTGLSTAASATLTGDAASDKLGSAVAGAGDVNGDGYDDVILGAQGCSTNAGCVYVYHGSSAGITTATRTLTGEAESDLFGCAVAGAGDVDGDGFADVIVGATGYSSTGRAYIYHGSSPGIAGQEDQTITGESANYLGYSVAGAGDVNGDGYGDVLVGAPSYFAHTGRVYIYHGSASGLPANADTTLTGYSDYREFGVAIDGAGDVNGDGYDDVIVGSVYLSGSGYVHVFEGSSAGVSTTYALQIAGPTSGISYGSAVSGAGDVNGDGYDDVIIGAYEYSSYRGRAYVHLGSASGTVYSAATTITGTAANEYLGFSLSDAGDVNGDGFGDVIIGSYGSSSSTGKATIYHGSSSGLSTSATTSLTGTSASDQLGYAVSGAGDVNRDGYDDVMVGAPGYATSTGRVTVYSGSSAGVGSTATTTLTGSLTYDYFGRALAGAGDVNADGYDDVLVGAYGYGTYGGAFVYPGSASGTALTATATMTGASTRFGFAVAGAGDVDADGYDDILVGDYVYGSYGGAAYVYESYVDADGDGLAATDDCDDGDATITNPYPVYADTDGDGYGDPTSSVEACASVAGHVVDATDCDDTRADVHPTATEVCDSADTDEDCDGLSEDADPGATGKTTLYADGDSDSFGATAADFCDAPAGYVANDSDCDDASSAVNPAQTEVCDPGDVDENCDGSADDADTAAVGQSSFYVDADADGFGSSTVGLYCDLPAGYASNADDCDDRQAATNPSAAELCDSGDIDEDCDGLSDDADPGATGQSTFFLDADGDGAGGPTTAAACEQPSGYVTSADDCDDTTAAVSPSATEVCDAANVDEDCNGVADDTDGLVTGRALAYTDADGDGFGSTTSELWCDPPSGWVGLDGDCDDTQALYYPGAAEVPGDEEDSDCDGGELCYADADGDGARGATTVVSSDLACDDAGEAAATATPDCDDTDASVGGGEAEIVGSGRDEDCDGRELCYVDADGDGYRVDETSTVESDDLDCADAGEADASAPVADCDDGDSEVHPGADEGNCVDPIDYNCDGSVGYADDDGDGSPACEDCDDSRTAVNPTATERCNGLDDDCEGTVDEGAEDAETWAIDSDGDGYTDSSVEVTACDAPDGYAAPTEEDCDDADADAHPEAVETPGDGVDQDCDGADAHSDSGAGEDDTGAQTPPGPECGCSSGPGTSGLLALAALAGATARRRRRLMLRAGELRGASAPR